LNQANAAAEKQAQLTQTKIDIEIAGNRGAAQLAEAERLAKRDIALAEGESRSKELLGIGEAARIASVGAAEAGVNRQKVDAYGDPRLYVANLLGDQLSRSHQPLVPERLIVLGGATDEAGKPQAQGSALLNLVLGLLAGEKAGIGMGAPASESKKAAATTTPAPGAKS
jgi:hypothetical protein